MRMGSLAMSVVVALTLLFLYLPICALIALSFTASPSALTFEGFSLHWYSSTLGQTAVQEALVNTLAVALSTATLATVLGTALVLARCGRPSRWILVSTAIAPLAVPEMIIGLGLLVVLSRHLRPLLDGTAAEVLVGSFASTVAGHTVLALGYVILTMRARLLLFDWQQVTAARDLGASTGEVLRFVLLPQIAPALGAAYLLACAVSVDDFYISYFAARGGTGFETLPLHLWNLQARHALTPAINVIATTLLVASGTIVVLLFMMRRFALRSASKQSGAQVIPVSVFGLGRSDEV